MKTKMIHLLLAKKGEIKKDTLNLLKKNNIDIGSYFKKRGNKSK